MTITAQKASDTTPAHSGNLIWEALEQPRAAHALLSCHQEGTYHSYTWDDWRAAAGRHAAGLRARGVVRGTRVACVLTNTLEVCATIIGVWLAGGVVVSLPTMRRGMRPQAYVDQLMRLSHSVDASMLLLEERFIELLSSDDFGLPLYGYRSIASGGRLDGTPPANDELAFVQFSSGSTSDPKGVMLTMGAISEQERMLRDRLQVDGDTQGVMWLPLSHDMGLFGCLLLSWVTGGRLAVAGGDRFLRKPQTWFEDSAAFQATIWATPNFGLALAARRARQAPPKDPFPLRHVIVGGERVEWDTLREADEVLGGIGVKLRTLTPAYGLAEATLAVTMKELDELPHAVTVDADRAYAGELELVSPSHPHARSFVACGPPVDRTSVRIDGAGGVGRICVCSSSLSSGYMNHPRATERRFLNGELVTEDLGFIHDGHLFVVGRTDDVIPIGARNVHARDVERELERCAGVRPGCSALIDCAPEGVEPRLMLVAEALSDDDRLDALASEIASAAYRCAGIRVSECLFLKAGELPKTPSGKVQRFRCLALATDPTEAAVRRRVPL
ncbi:MAG TPA: AMP-binding protein [Solirubrobacteraceae bacterium]|jgi:fatty-acyl-CoA synthase|nr:AMP-binding protein [Solirubrobacteraceae bacterium]